MKIIKLFILILFIISIKYLNYEIISVTSINIKIYSKKIWVGENYKMTIEKQPINSNEKIYLKSSNTKIVEIFKDFIKIKSCGNASIIAYTKKKIIKARFNITAYSTPELSFKETNPIRIEGKSFKQLNLDSKDYPKKYIKYYSNHPEIIRTNNEGKIISFRPGNAIITASGLDGINTKVKVISISIKGLLLNNDLLDYNNASRYKNIMIVAHPDDETLWGGFNLYKDSYFVVCLTNGYNLERASNFRELLKFTKNNGIILNYPDKQDNIIDDWSYVEGGILKDLSKILN